MSLVDFNFFCFLLGSLIVYYLVGERLQKYVLLAASVFFFVCASGEKVLPMTAILLLVMVLTYGGARVLPKEGNRKRAVCAALVIALLVTNLVVLKYVFHLGELVLGIFRVEADISWLSFAAPIGISYFTLSAIGYLMEVFWGNYEPERNFVVVADFICFFPQIISGPITRFGEMGAQFKKRHFLVYENVRNGAIRMLWGYFKKLVIADRVAPVVQAVYANYQDQNTLILLFVMVLYAIQLYTDFSGCMDIVLGAARMFGIVLPENFDSPFYSRNMSEFWRRWHITLGAWFKEFVMYPVLKTRGFVNLGKKAKKRFGKHLGKKVPTYLSLLLVWFLLGLWHGGEAHFFMASAMIPCTYLILGDFLEPQFDSLRKKCKITPDNPAFVAFGRIRTVFLMCISWIFICTESVQEGFWVLKCLVTNVTKPVDIMAVLAEGNMGTGKLLLLVCCVVVLLIVDYLEYQKISVIGLLNRVPLLIRFGVLYILIAIVLLYGMVGSSSFIYFQF